MWLHSLKVAQLLRSAASLCTNQSLSYLNHLVPVFQLVRQTPLLSEKLHTCFVIEIFISVVLVEL